MQWPRRADAGHTVGVQDPYAAEAADRWGNTEAFRESRRRAASYAPADWDRIREESAAIERRLALSMAAGVPAHGAVAVALAEEHRQHLSRWFYECDLDMHRALADLYVDDERFTAHYDEVAPGLARYLHDAVVANAQRA